MARPVDYRKGRGSKGVHTEDEPVPIGKKISIPKTTAAKAQKAPIPKLAYRAPKALAARAPKPKGKHAAGHEGQARKLRSR